MPEDTSMVRCFSALLTLAVCFGVLSRCVGDRSARARIQFFSRSGQDPEDDLAYFRGHLGILRPTFTDNRLYAAYRIMLGGASRRSRPSNCSPAVAMLRIPLRRDHELERPAQARAGVTPAKENDAVPTAARGHAAFSTSRAFRMPIAIPPRRYARASPNTAPTVRWCANGLSARTPFSSIARRI